ncbi:MAG: hypothetical protein ACJAZN_002983, partial [Planctomycetota bacterium]
GARAGGSKLPMASDLGLLLQRGQDPEGRCLWMQTCSSVD